MMTKIDESMIEKVRESNDIVDCISEYVQLTKRGKNWFGLCPFHNEQSPSFSVTEDKQLYHCFGCGASGTVINFIMDIENRTFPDAVGYLAEKAGITVDIGTHASQPKQEIEPRLQRMMDAHALAAEFYHHLLMNTEEGEPALQYLLERGFTQEELEKLQIGWSLPISDALANVLADHEFEREPLVEGGLLFQNEDGSFFDRFRNRIMFPIENREGKIVGFSGRVLEKEDGPKYLNSQETPIFEKSKILYNIHRARMSIRKNNRVILFEGFMDSIAAMRGELNETVAMMGTSLSTDHLMQMKRLTNHLYICCDGDEAGMEAGYRVAKLAMQEKMDVKLIILPQGMDPDDYIGTYGIETFEKKMVEMAHSFMNFMLQYARRNKNLKLDYEIEQYIHEVVEELALRSSPIERELVIQALADQTGISQALIEQQLEQRVQRQAKQVVQTKPHIVDEGPVERKVFRKSEMLLLAHALSEAAYYERILEEGHDVFIDETFMTLFLSLAAFYEEHQTIDADRFLETLTNRLHQQIVGTALRLERAVDHGQREVEDCIAHLHAEKLRHRITAKKEELKRLEQNNDREAANRLLVEVIELTKQLKK